MSFDDKTTNNSTGKPMGKRRTATQPISAPQPSESSVPPASGPVAPGPAPTTVEAPPTTVALLRASSSIAGWQDLFHVSPAGEAPELKETAEKRASAARSQLNDLLSAVLTTPNLIVLAGSGASLGKVGGPSMGDLWDKSSQLPDFDAVCVAVKHPTTDRWIENLLSRCRLSLQFLDGTTLTKVSEFLSMSEIVIWNECSVFLAKANLEAHRTFLKRMARRRLRSPRLRLFTTNYDICFETASGDLGITVIDGFSYSHPRRFDPRFFSYDMVRRAKGNDEAHHFVEGVVQVLKLHGSVNWDDTDAGIVQATTPQKPCLIYPTSTKYEQSYSQPHLELMSQFQAALREPNTCLITVGFGFNDNHLAAPILAAVQSNPSFKLFVVDRSAKTKSTDPLSVFGKLAERIAKGEADVALLNAEFAQFSGLIPDLRALSPAEEIEIAVKQIARKS